MGDINKLFFEIIDNFQNGFIVTNEKGDILYVNSTFCDLLGYEKSNIVNNKKIWELNYNINTYALFNKKIQDLEHINNSKKYYTYIKKDGTLLSCMIQNCIYKDVKSEKTYYFSIIHNTSTTLYTENYFSFKKEITNNIEKLKIPLFTIMTSVSAFRLKDELNLKLTDDDVKLNLDAIENSANRLNNLIKNLNT